MWVTYNTVLFSSYLGVKQIDALYLKASIKNILVFLFSEFAEYSHTQIRVFIYHPFKGD